MSVNQLKKGTKNAHPFNINVHSAYPSELSASVSLTLILFDPTHLLADVDLDFISNSVNRYSRSIERTLEVYKWRKYDGY